MDVLLKKVSTLHRPTHWNILLLSKDKFVPILSYQIKFVFGDIAFTYKMCLYLRKKLVKFVNWFSLMFKLNPHDILDNQFFDSDKSICPVLCPKDK